METTPHDVTIAHTVGCSAARHETKNPAEEEAQDGSTTVSHVATGTSQRGVLVEKSPHNVTIFHTVGCSASRHETKNPAEEEARDGSATGSHRATGVLIKTSGPGDSSGKKFARPRRWWLLVH